MCDFRSKMNFSSALFTVISDDSVPNLVPREGIQMHEEFVLSMYDSILSLALPFSKALLLVFRQRGYLFWRNAC
jgi:hypothetical protein